MKSRASILAVAWLTWIAACGGRGDPGSEPVGCIPGQQQSPYHGDFRVTDVYAFNGEPPTHLITDAGLLLRMNDGTCSAMSQAGCFVKDGALGTLTGQQVFAGMDSDAAGKVYGLVSLSSDISSPSMAGSYVAQRIDVASRLVESKSDVLRLTVAKMIRARHDPTSQNLLVGYSVGSQPFPSDVTGHRVALVPYQ